MFLPVQKLGVSRLATTSASGMGKIEPSLKNNPQAERSCKSNCGSPLDDSYTACTNFCECLWATDNSVWRCIVQYVTDQRQVVAIR